MSLLGIDVGTTGCKASVFSEDGTMLGTRYAEYDIQRPEPGWEELDCTAVWERVKQVITGAISAARARSPGDPVVALSVSSLGEAMAPVSADGTVLGPSMLNSDARGAEFLPELGERLPDPWLYRINGNVLGNHYSLPKLLWLQRYRPELWARTWKFLHWSGFVSFMLGAPPAVDYSLANRTLLFDVDRERWSDAILDRVGLTAEKLPDPVPSGQVLGTVRPSVAAELGLGAAVKIVAGAHDQCANAVGAGVTASGRAMYGMGTYVCALPVFEKRPAPEIMIPRGLNTEHHAASGRYVSFIYNHGGSMVKWFRDTFAAADKALAAREGRDVYDTLFAELPEGPGAVFVLPHFAPTGPPRFIADSAGVIAGLHLDTPRGAVLKGILEGLTFYIRESLENLPPEMAGATDFHAVGGGSKSDAWLQVTADILGRPVVRPAVTEAGTLGAAVLAGVGAGCFGSAAEGAERMVRLEREFDPDPARVEAYTERFIQYRKLGPAFEAFLREIRA